jgi:hypothetical protein
MADGRKLEESRRHAAASFGRDAREERENPLFEGDLPAWASSRFDGAGPTDALGSVTPETGPKHPSTTQILGQA